MDTLDIKPTELLDAINDLARLAILLENAGLMVPRESLIESFNTLYDAWLADW